MNKGKHLVVLFLAITEALNVSSGEGMWLPNLLDSLNYEDMKEKGLRLTPDEIYSINQASLKDAIVIFGGGCTAELISPDGLLITNHHCGYSRIQAHSTVDTNYLADGFWARSRSDELPNPGLSVTFLIRIEDVTDKVLKDIPDSISEDERNRKVSINASIIEEEATLGTKYNAEVKSFYYGREYYLFIYENFTDVRLVGAPPEAIGRFGGDTDNWIWPRHTGDFSLFRIYAGKDNEPSSYSPENVPYKPRKYLKISADGIKEGDFTMVLGYPGRTDEYLMADGLDMIAGKALPAKIEMRGLRLNAIANEMAKGPALRLGYSSQYVSISNSWKKWIGVVKGVERSGAIQEKQQLEKDFDRWARELKSDPAGYSSLVTEINNLYASLKPLYLSNDLANELLNSLTVFNQVGDFMERLYMLRDSSEHYKKDALQSMKNLFRSNSFEIDKLVMPSLLRIYAVNTDDPYHPAFYQEIESGFNNDYNKYVDYLFNSSVFTNSTRYARLLSKPLDRIQKKVMADPMSTLLMDFSKTLMYSVYRQSDSLNLEINRLNRRYLTGLMAMETSHVFYPDANFTMRVAYGKVEGYKPTDAVDYSYYSTLDGIIEKENPDITDYLVPEKLKELYANNDQGPYTEDGKVPVCFIASNHTSGGNSGSPVMNAEGNLIGINFDRNWEGTVSDYAYDPAVCRNISLDIRYVLFVIDKVADADWLLDELTILNN
jgi:hypothetical protein